MIGATQNSQSCTIAQSPVNKATPVLRAGFTEWPRVRDNPDAEPVATVPTPLKVILCDIFASRRRTLGAKG